MDVRSGPGLSRSSADRRCDGPDGWAQRAANPADTTGLSKVPVAKPEDHAQAPKRHQQLAATTARGKSCGKYFRCAHCRAGQAATRPPCRPHRLYAGLAPLPHCRRGAGRIFQVWILHATSLTSPHDDALPSRHHRPSRCAGFQSRLPEWLPATKQGGNRRLSVTAWRRDGLPWQEPAYVAVL